MYAWGGFVIESNAELPRLHVARREGDPLRFAWRAGSFRPPHEARARWEIRAPNGTPVELAVGGDEEELWYETGGVGVYLLRAGPRTVDFFPEGEPEPARVEHVLVNNVLPMYAGLAGTVCLHAAAVVRDGEAVVFAGPSGAGKSTRAWRLVADGWLLLSDDAVVLRPHEGTWRAFPGARTVRVERLDVAGSWDNMGKRETFANATAEPHSLREIAVLVGSEPSQEPNEAVLWRSLVILQAAWRWAGEGTRRTLGAATLDLLETVPVRLEIREALSSEP